MRTLLIFAATVSLYGAHHIPFTNHHKADEWKSIFDGTTLEGWKANEHPESWSVKDGAIRGDGPASHLFYMDEKCVNCEFKADVRINHAGNSGMYFRTAFGPGFPKGYEAQIDNTHSDPVRTGSLYGFVEVHEQLIQDDTWWTQRIVVEGNHIQIFVNDKQTADFIDEKNTYTSGYLALQQHNQGGVVEFKNLMMRTLPAPRSPLVGTWRLNRAESKFSAGESPTQLEIRIQEERDGGLRYQSESTTTDGEKHSGNYFARPDGYDYRMVGSPTYDHVSLELLDPHHVHQVFRTIKFRKKLDEHVYQVITKMHRDVVGKAYYFVSADGKTLTREGTTKHADGVELHYTEVLEKVEMKTTRRELLFAAAAAAPLFAQEKPSANDRVQIGLIGAGGQGMADVRASLANGSKLVAVADIYDGRLLRSQELWGKSVITTRDYRELLARQDVDAVIIATPDHWHQKISVDAMNAGKDVYCEKPMVQVLGDGRDMIATAGKTARIFQAGSQRVSSVVYQKAKDLLAAGAIGELNLVEAWWDRNAAIGAWQYSIPPDASPATIDWDRFLGRAPKVPFEPMRLFRWRNYRDYGTGVAGDLFVHLFSGMHFVTGAIGPTRVYATGGLRFWNDGRDVPDVLLGLYDYPKTARHPAFNLALRVNFVNGAGETSGFRFVGSEGIMTIDDAVTVSKQPRETEPGYTIGTFPQAVQNDFLREYREKYPMTRANADSIRPQAEDRYAPPRGYDDHVDHHRNFLDAVRTRKPVVEDATFGFRAAGPAVLSNVSYFEQRACAWDPETMTLKS